jgi:hypothetical protein
MKIKKDVVVKLWNELEKISQSGAQPIKYSYFIAKNKSAIKDEATALTSIVKPSESFAIYDSKRAELARSLADKDADGNPLIVNGSYQLTENEQAFQKQFAALKEEFKETIDEVEKQVEKYNELLEETFNFKGYKIKMADLPQTMESATLELFIELNLIEE